MNKGLQSDILYAMGVFGLGLIIGNLTCNIEGFITGHILGIISIIGLFKLSYRKRI